MTTALAVSHDYPPEHVDQALLVLALCGGNSVKASNTLAEQGVQIPDSTLRYWRLYTHPQRYQSIQENEAKKLEELLIAQQRELAISASSAALQAVDAARADIEAGTVKDPARAAQALQTTAGIASDKMLTLQGRPAIITQAVNTTETLKRISQRFQGVIVDAEVIEDQPMSELSTGSHEPNARD